jgi:transposase InsO family protein
METKDQQLKQQIIKVHQDDPGYGHRRVALALKINKKRILRVMNKYGIKPPRRRVRHYLTRSTPQHSYQNLIWGWKAQRVHQVWASDLSYVKYHGKFWYLVTVLDHFTRQILSVQLGTHHSSDLVLAAIKQAILNHKDLPEIFHSDQGTEFMAQPCTQFLEQYGVKISVSETGSPWQNGYQESFFDKFKLDMGDVNRFETIGLFIEAVYRQVHYYNHRRIHTALKMPPSVFANAHLS